MQFNPDTFLLNDPLVASGNLFLLVQKLVIAVLIGILIGMEREHSRPKESKIFAGIRTFTLISVFGFISSLISDLTSIWVYIVIFAGYSALITAAYVFSAKDGRLGGTSEVTALVVFVLGSLVYMDYLILAASIAVLITFLLSIKIQIHAIVGKISEDDIYATLKLALVSVIILPLLPDETFGPFDVLNPRLIWYMVIFVSGISFIGYLLIKFYGKGKGIPITGLMGGFVSSTAVAFSLARKSKIDIALSGNLAAGVLLASSVMYLRIIFIVALLNFDLALKLFFPVLIFTMVGFSVSYYFTRKTGSIQHQDIEIKNPFEIRSAFFFGLMFGAVLFLVKAAEYYIGINGIYYLSALSGISSVDAIVVSVANLSVSAMNPDVAAAAIVIAFFTNNIIKIAISFIWGSAGLSRITTPGLGIMSLSTAVYLLFML